MTESSLFERRIFNSSETKEAKFPLHVRNWWTCWGGSCIKAIPLVPREQREAWQIKKHLWLVVNAAPLLMLAALCAGSARRLQTSCLLCLLLKSISPPSLTSGSSSSVPSYTLNTHTLHACPPSLPLHFTLPQPSPSWERVSRLDGHPADPREPLWGVAIATMADEDRESPAGTVVMALAVATEVGGARGHTSLAFIQTRRDCCGRVRLPTACACPYVCMLSGSWLVLSLHTVQGAKLVTRQALQQNSQDVCFCQKWSERNKSAALKTSSCRCRIWGRGTTLSQWRRISWRN